MGSAWGYDLSSIAQVQSHDKQEENIWYHYQFDEPF
jgi:hypothetical protein